MCKELQYEICQTIYCENGKTISYYIVDRIMQHRAKDNVNGVTNGREEI